MTTQPLIITCKNPPPVKIWEALAGVRLRMFMEIGDVMKFWFEVDSALYTQLKQSAIDAGCEAL